MTAGIATVNDRRNFQYTNALAINRFLRIWTSAALFSIHYISNIYDWFCQISPKYAANDVELSLKSLYFADQVERIYRLPSTIEP